MCGTPCVKIIFQRRGVQCVLTIFYDDAANILGFVVKTTSTDMVFNYMALNVLNSLFNVALDVLKRYFTIRKSRECSYGALNVFRLFLRSDS